MAVTFDSITKHVGESARIQWRALSSNKTALFATCLLVGLVAMSSEAVAGAATSGSDEDTFGEVWDTLEGWTQGTFGRIIALTLVLVGAAMGVVRQSLITFVVGVAMGLGLYNAPSIIDTVMGASIEDIAIQVEAGIKTFGNGMQ